MDGKENAAVETDEIITVKPDEFLRGNVEEIWEMNYIKENIFEFEITDGNNKVKLSTYSFVPENPKGVVVFFHGMGGYMKTSAYLAKMLSEAGYAVYGHDYRGHGKSEGKRGVINDVEILIEDSKSFIKKVKELHKGLPVYIGGSSLGGNIAYKISSRSPGEFKGVFLFSPALKPIQNCFTYYLAVCAGSLFPCCSISVGEPKESTKNAYAWEKISSDPYLIKGSYTLGTIKSILQAASNCELTFKDYKETFIVFLGGRESVVCPVAITNLFKQSPSKNKKMYLYENMYHNVLMEDESFDVIKKLVEWLNKQSTLC